MKSICLLCFVKTVSNTHFVGALPVFCKSHQKLFREISILYLLHGSEKANNYFTEVKKIITLR